MTSRSTVAVALAAAVLAGCRTDVGFDDVLGLWVAAEGADTTASAPLTLRVEVVHDGGGPCWSGVTDDGTLPVRWPDGTIADLGAASEAELRLPDDTTVPAGDTIQVTGRSVGPGTPPDQPPSGCDLGDGWIEVAP